jgi:hypothetical protein
MIEARAAGITLDDVPRLCVEAVSLRGVPGARDAAVRI